MKGLNDFFANSPLGGYLKMVIGLAVGYLLSLLATDQSFANFEWKTLGYTVAGPLLVVLYNWANPKDTRYGKHSQP
jgi:hypothetical protein